MFYEGLKGVKKKKIKLIFVYTISFRNLETVRVNKKQPNWEVMKACIKRSFKGYVTQGGRQEV